MYLSVRASSLLLCICAAAGFSGCGKAPETPATPATPAASEPLPSVGAVTPASGSGKTQTFTATYAHPQGAKSVVSAWFLVEEKATGTNSCFLEYKSSNNNVNLMDDAGKWQTEVLVGSSAKLANSQCSVDVAGVRAAADGNTLTVTWPITFTPAYAGPKQVFLLASSVKSATPWTPKGSWDVK